MNRYTVIAVLVLILVFALLVHWRTDALPGGHDAVPPGPPSDPNVHGSQAPPASEPESHEAAGKPVPEEPATAAEEKPGKLTQAEIGAYMRLINVQTAQAQFRAKAVVDENGNKVGEFASLEELAGVAVLRGSDAKLSPPLMGMGTAAKLCQDGTLEHDGYLYRIYLPRAGGSAASEDFSGALPAGLVDAAAAEKRFVLYAWPKEYGVTGRRTFVQIDTGRPLWTDCSRYTGAQCPSPDAAFVPEPGRSGSITGELARDREAADGNTWRPLR